MNHSQWTGREHSHDHRMSNAPSNVTIGCAQAAPILGELSIQLRVNGYYGNLPYELSKEENLLYYLDQPSFPNKQALEIDLKVPEFLAQDEGEYKPVPPLSPSVPLLHNLPLSPDAWDSDSFLPSLEASSLSESCQVMEDDYYFPLTSRRTSDSLSISIASECDAKQVRDHFPELFSASDISSVESGLVQSIVPKAEKVKEDWPVGLNASSLLQLGYVFSPKTEPNTLSPIDALLSAEEEQGKSSLPTGIFKSETLNPSVGSTYTLAQIEREASILSSCFEESSVASFVCSVEEDATTQPTKLHSTSAPSDEEDFSLSDVLQDSRRKRRPSQNSTCSDESSAASSDCDFTPLRNGERPAGQYACADCIRKYDRAQQLGRHRRKKHALSTRCATLHKCTLPNPNSGRSCSTAFSRSYDLVRHQETIHAKKRIVLRCEHCSDLKTFSRQDALVRHRRVKHLVRDGK